MEDIMIDLPENAGHCGNRPSKDKWALGLAMLTAERGTCVRRRVGCVLLNERGHVLATGYNGVASGQPHCNEVYKSPVYHDDSRVKFDDDTVSFVFNNQHVLAHKGFRTRNEQIERTRSGDGQCVGFEYLHHHACAGATAPSGQSLDACQAIHAEQNALLQCRDIYAIHTCYVTASPCMTCTKLLLNTSCRRIVFLEEYAHTDAGTLWESSGREWFHDKSLPNWQGIGQREPCRFTR